MVQLSARSYAHGSVLRDARFCGLLGRRWLGVSQLLGGVAVAAFEIAAAEVVVCLHVADRGAASELAFDDTEHTLLTRDEDAARIWSMLTAGSLVDVGALSP